MKFFSPVLWVAVFAWPLISCTDEDTSEVSKEESLNPPEQAFEELSSNDTITLEETLILKAPENIKEASIYLNEDFLTTIKNSPFQFNFNSGNYPDGLHTLSAEVLYLNGEKKTYEIPIHILNTLATVTFPEDAFEYYTRIYLVASGKEGEILGVTAIEEPGVQQVMAARKELSPTISLSVVNYKEPGESLHEDMMVAEDFLIRTINGVPLQSQTHLFSYQSELDNNMQGTLSIQIPDFEDQSIVYYNQSNTYSEIYKVREKAFEISAHGNPSWLGFYKVAENQLYYKLLTANPEETIRLQTAEIHQPFQQKPLPQGSFYGYRLSLVPDEDHFPAKNIDLESAWLEEEMSIPANHYLAPEDPELAYLIKLYTDYPHNPNLVSAASYYGKNRELSSPDFIEIKSAELNTAGQLTLITNKQNYSYSMFEMDYFTDALDIEWYLLSPPEMEHYQLPHLQSIDTIQLFKRIPDPAEFSPYGVSVFSYSQYPHFRDFIEKGIFPDGINYLSLNESEFATWLELEEYEEEEGGRISATKKRRKFENYWKEND